MTTKAQEKMIAEMFRMILHLEVEIVDTNPTYYNGNRWSNDVANIFYQCEKGGKTVENMEKVILLAHGWMEENGNCYIDDADGNEENWKKFWKLEEDVWEICRLQRDGFYSEAEEAEEAEENIELLKKIITKDAVDFTTEEEDQFLSLLEKYDDSLSDIENKKAQDLRMELMELGEDKERELSNRLYNQMIEEAENQYHDYMYSDEYYINLHRNTNSFVDEQ
jgi:hypothetical protein